MCQNCKKRQVTNLRREVGELKAHLVASGLAPTGAGSSRAPNEARHREGFAPVRPYWANNGTLEDLSRELAQLSDRLVEGMRLRGRGGDFSEAEERALRAEIKVLKEKVAEARKGTAWGENTGGAFAPVRPYWLVT